MIGIERLNGERVRIEFQHLQAPHQKGVTQPPLLVAESKFEGGKPVPIRAQTSCSIVIRHVTDDGQTDLEILGNGVALCSMKDAFSRDAGRARALVAALKASRGWGAISEEEVGTLIESYNNRPRKKAGITLDKTKIMETING